MKDRRTRTTHGADTFGRRADDPKPDEPRVKSADAPARPRGSGSDRPLLVLVGCTATGKTSVAIELARHFGGEIVSADARQVYRHLDIGTAKPTYDEMNAAHHHIVDHVDPVDSYNAGLFTEEADAAIEAIRAKGMFPIIAGGTGLYLRALIHGLDPAVGRDPALRDKLEREADKHGVPALHKRLAKVDATSAERIHENDRVRIIRALEIHSKTGRTRTAVFADATETPRHDALWAGLAWNRETLYRRINKRLDVMMEDGLLAEVKGLLAMGYDPGLSCFRSPGYREILESLDGRYDLHEALDRAKRETRRFAKRQATWFRKEAATWFEATERDPAEVAAAIATWYESGGAAPASDLAASDPLASGDSDTRNGVSVAE